MDPPVLCDMFVCESTNEYVISWVCCGFFYCVVGFYEFSGFGKCEYMYWFIGEECGYIFLVGVFAKEIDVVVVL